MDFVSLDRDIATVVPLAVGRDWEEYRHISGKGTLRELREQESGPLRDALITWIEWLTVARVSQPAERALVDARSTERTTVRLSRGDVQMTEPEIAQAMLAAPTVGEARSLFSAWPEAIERLRSAEHRLRATRDEAFHRLDIDDVPRRFLGVSRSDLGAMGERFLTLTGDLAEEVARSEWPFALDLRLGRHATEGWPARLTWRTVSELLPGLALRATLPKPPPAVGAVSFARALAMLGVAFRRTCAPESTPFVLREPPLFVDAHRTAYLFAAITQEPSFHMRTLSLPPGRAKDQAREVRLALFLHARTVALCAALGGPSPDVEALTALAFGQPLPWRASREDDMAQLVALLSSLERIDALREREGDDWFRNPKAFSTLRDMTQNPTEPRRDVESLAKRFEVLLA